MYYNLTLKQKKKLLPSSHNQNQKHQAEDPSQSWSQSFFHVNWDTYIICYKLQTQLGFAMYFPGSVCWREDK